MVIGSIITSYTIISKQINRFNNNPTVISLDRNYRSWNGTLPGLTLCYHDFLDPIRADNFIQNTWNISVNDYNYAYYMDFLSALVNATINDYVDIVKFSNDQQFEELNLYDVIKAVHRPLKQNLNSFHDNIKVLIFNVMTEKGMCVAINAPMTEVLTERNKIVKEIEKPILCQYGKHECFIKLDIFESTGTIEMHSPYEVSATDAGVGKLDLNKNDDVIASYKVSETFAIEETLKVLSPDQRKCNFPDELTTGLSIYSQTLCYTRCRGLTALEMCNCIPHFYPFIDGPLCTPSGFECLSDIKWPIWALHVCNCPNPCVQYVYSVHSIKKNIRAKSANKDDDIVSSFRWEIIPPKVRMRRDIVFSFEDLLVSVGGAIGLFLGASFLTLLKVGVVSLQWLATNLIDMILGIKTFFSKLISRR